MLSATKTLKGYSLDSLDGEIGKVSEFYFDDRYWTIRYLVANTGYWLPGRKVLISPHSLVAIERDLYSPKIKVDLTKKQIEKSPSLDCDKPVSRQFEDSYYGYYGYPAYWAGPYVWGAYPNPVNDRDLWKSPAKHGSRWDSHLRSTKAVSGYLVDALDGEIGHVEDFVVDDETWAIRYLIVKTKNWWPGNKVLISPHWVDKISWDERSVSMDLSRESIKQSAPYSEEGLLTREYETGLHSHYNRKGYWVEDFASTR